MPETTSGTAGEDRRPTGAATVGDLMGPVTAVEPDAHVASAAYLMSHAQQRALVVTAAPEHARRLQVVTDADISQAVADGRDLGVARIHQLHLRQVEPLDPGTPVAEAAERMLAAALQHLPVLDDGRLVGLVDMAAVCRALLAATRRGPGPGAPDSPAERNVGG